MTRIKIKECEVCGCMFETIDGRKRQCDDCLNWKKTIGHKEIGLSVSRSWNNLAAKEWAIKQRFEEKERTSTIVGEGYAERQIADTLRLVGKVKTEL